MALIMGIVIRHKTKKQTVISAGVTLVIWIGFFTFVKNALSHTLKHSVDNLSAALEDSPENIVQLASQIQWKLTAAIFAFFILVFAMIYWFTKKQKKTYLDPSMILGMMSAGSCMIIGYYIAETILYGNAISPVFSIPMNLVQFVTGIVITILIAPALLKVIPKEKL
jgi:hypothetical protein